VVATADDSARVFITFMIAVATVAIAFFAMLIAMMLREYEKRFALAKEVLTILVGILGTIVGFYFGTAKITPTTDSNTNGATQPVPTPTVNPAPTAYVLRRPTGQFVLVVDRANERS
jgi:predicted permease